MGELGILLDLAHAGPRTFADAMAVARPDRPVIVSHTGVRAVHDHWRNLSDDQIRAVADRGGVVGVILHRGFLARPGWRARAATVAAHLAHVARVGGPPVRRSAPTTTASSSRPATWRRWRTCPASPRCSCRRASPPEQVVRVLGTNALTVIGAVRPGPPVRPRA